MARRSNESRKTLGYTQKDVARMAGVSERTVRYYEAGQSSNLKLAQFYRQMDAQVKKIETQLQRRATTAYVSGSRREAGVSLQDIAIVTGLSKSTISRYESGQSVSKSTLEKLDKFYHRMEQNIKYLGQLQSLESQVWGRVKELAAIGMTHTPAMLQLASRTTKDGEERSPHDLLRGEVELGLGSEQSVKRYIKYLEEFLTKQTSTVEGTEKWLHNVQTASMETSGLTDAVSNDIYWRLYNKLLEDNTMSDYWSVKEQKFLSTQAQDAITEVFNEVVFDPYWVDIYSDDVDVLYEALKEKLTNKGK